MLALALCALTVAACQVIYPTPVATRTVTVDISGLDRLEISHQVKEGSVVNVEVSVTQPGEEGVECAVPTVHDAHGNVMATLSPVNGQRGRDTRYMYSFVAATDGRYTVEFDNGQCAARQAETRADVVWKVREP